MKNLILAIFLTLNLTACHKLVIKKPDIMEFKNAYEDKYSVPIKMDRVMINIPKGEIIGKYMLHYDCKGPFVDVYSSSIRTFIEDIELEDIFYDEMTIKGYDVVGDPHRMYDLSDDNARAKYKIGAQITGIRTNLCRDFNYFFNWEKGIDGEMEMDVFWQIYDIKHKEVALETRTKGYFKLDVANPYGFGIMFNESFASAAEVLANNKDLQKLIFTKKSNEVKKIYEKWPFKSMVLPKVKLFKDDIKENIPYVRESTVLVRSGSGHGSGFFISKDGYVLTNHHVIGDSQEIFIEDEFGKEMVAKLVRTHKGRDVALLKLKGADNLDIKPLPIRKSQADIGEDVYAVGAPLDTALKNTVTKGIVSSWREPHYSYSLIQADVDIQGGNSGGPLLDDKGNVVGISVSGLAAEDTTSIGINFFIPIADALNKLNISFE